MGRSRRALPSLKELEQLWGTRPRSQTFWPMILLVAVGTAVLVLYKTIQNIESSGLSDRKKGMKNGNLRSSNTKAKDNQFIENCSGRGRWRNLKRNEVRDNSSRELDDFFENTETSPDSSSVLERKTLPIQPGVSSDSNFEAIPNEEKEGQRISNTRGDPTAVRRSAAELVINDDSDTKKSIPPGASPIWCCHYPTTKDLTTPLNSEALEMTSSSCENTVPSGPSGLSGSSGPSGLSELPSLSEPPGPSDSSGSSEASGSSDSGLRKVQNPFALIRDNYTCYVNAGLQLLMADPDFYESLAKFVDNRLKIDEFQHPATMAFVGFVRRCLQGSRSANNPGYFRPHEVIEYIQGARPGDFKAGEQADCAEFVSTMLTEIGNEVLSDASPVKMFEGVLVTNETSNAGDVQLKPPIEETFTSIQIGLGWQHFTIENCFDFFTRKETVECRQGVYFSQRLFKTLPSLLLVQLQPIEKRKDGTIVKINDQLILEEVLYFRKDWMVEDSSPPSLVALPSYSLMALVYHSGRSHHSGHYTAGVKRSDQDGRLRWFFCDDQCIEESTRTKIRTALPDNALCLLLYKQEKTLSADINPNKDIKQPTSSGTLEHTAVSRANEESSLDDIKKNVFTKRSENPKFKFRRSHSPFDYSNMVEDFQNMLKLKIRTIDGNKKSYSLPGRSSGYTRSIVNAKKSGIIERKPRKSHKILPAEELLVLNDINPLSAEDVWSEEPAGLMKLSPSLINAGLQVLSVDPLVWKYVNDGVNFWRERNRFNMPASQAFLDFMENRRIVMTSPFTPPHSTLMPEEVIKYLSENCMLNFEPFSTQFVTAMLSLIEDEITDHFSPTKHLLTGVMMNCDDREKMLFESLPLEPSSNFCQFEDCMTKYFVEVDEGERHPFRRARFYTLPPILLIAMDNFGKPPCKPWKVLLGESLVIKQDWLHESSPERKSELPRYNLRAVIYRSADDHYTAGVKLHEKSEWYLCDDEDVEESRFLGPLEDRYPMNSLHLLLYKRQSEDT